MLILRFLFLISATTALFSTPFWSQAAFITTNEAGMDAVFSQANFGGNPIDIVFNAPVILDTVALGSGVLTDISTPAQLTELFSLSPAASPTVNMFFVDTINECGGFNPSIVGCANTPGNDIVVESVFAAGASGTELHSHELGHNLNLLHTASIGNLMDPTLNGNTNLTPAQVTTILSSPLVQGTAPNEFITITPVLITGVALSGSGVPEPSSFLLIALGMIGLTKVRRRR